MTSICSAHRYYVPGCKQCNAMPNMSVLFTGAARSGMNSGAPLTWMFLVGNHDEIELWRHTYQQILE